MEAETKLMRLFTDQPLHLECGAELSPVMAAYETYGTLNEDGSNAILICHALSGDAHAGGSAVITDEILKKIPFYKTMKEGQPGWWDGMIGPGRAFDTNKYFVICSNILGSCYGTSGPADVNPQTGRLWQKDFPAVTVRDMVRVQYTLLQKLGVKKLHSISGGSLGGMQALEWAVMYPDFVKSIIPIATAARHSAWAVGFNHLARQAVTNDPVWENGYYKDQPARGLSLARQIGMISYRTDISFQRRFGRERLDDENGYLDEANLFQSESYLNYQGEKLVNRFDANCFLAITRAIDWHDLSQGRTSLEDVMKTITARALCIGIDTDILYPAHEQQEICQLLTNAQYHEIQSTDGHDAFLIEFGQLTEVIKPFLNSIS
ncbi:MAG: homoserine O-acetyltransferase [Calditrichaceae bacterium]|nr:homoserine O-acetyltransferase [Calditrichaceae bacterium]MBN2710703.1 homoserine O-acetyltransferase [Calditrichaceae bacterium]RQV92732.1 MAG: homoserine O-acetyltransferase [Calditrichota bacterium]